MRKSKICKTYFRRSFGEEKQALLSLTPSKIKICRIANNDKFVKFNLLPQLKFLVKEGYDVYVVCSPGKWVADIEKEGIKVKTIKIKRKISSLYDLVTLYRLWNYFRKEKFQIVHTHNPKPGLLGQLAAKMAGVPIVINTIHGFYFQENSSLLKRKFFIIIEKIAAKCSDLIFFVNKEDMKTALQERICSDKLIKYLGGAVDINKFSPDLFSQSFIVDKKEELGIKSDQKVVGIIARLVEEKGYIELFEALGTIIKKFPRAVLLVVGSEEKHKKDFFDPNFFKKKYKLEKNVIFLGERDNVDQIYPLIDVFVLPSHREGLGLVILEASAMEKPVVATNIRGCREAVDNGKTGVLVPAKNAEKLAKAIIYFLENPMEAQKMGENGRIKVIKEFNEDLVFGRIKEEYQKLIESL